MGRFIKLLRRDFLTHYKGVVVGAGAVAALFTLFLVVLPAFNSDPEPIFDKNFHVAGYLIAVVLGGWWFSSGIWSDLNTTQSRQHFLTIPASTLEKYLSKWLLSGPLFLIVATLAYLLFSILINTVAQGYPGVEYNALDFTHEAIVQVLPLYLIIQPTYLLAGIWFGRFAFVKVSIVGLVFQFLYIGFIAGLGGLLFDGLDERMEGNFNFVFNDLDRFGLGAIQSSFLLLGVLVAVFFAYIGYVRLQERGA